MIISELKYNDKVTNLCYIKDSLYLQHECVRGCNCDRCELENSEGECQYDPYVCGYYNLKNKSKGFEKSYFTKIRKCKYNYVDNIKKLSLDHFKYKIDIPIFKSGKWYTLNNGSTVRILSQDITLNNKDERHYTSSLRCDAILINNVVLIQDNEFLVKILDIPNEINVEFNLEEHVSKLTKRIQILEDNISKLTYDINNFKSLIQDIVEEKFGKLSTSVDSLKYNENIRKQNEKQRQLRVKMDADQRKREIVNAEKMRREEDYNDFWKH